MRTRRWRPSTVHQAAIRQSTVIVPVLILSCCFKAEIWRIFSVHVLVQCSVLRCWALSCSCASHYVPARTFPSLSIMRFRLSLWFTSWAAISVQKWHISIVQIMIMLMHVADMYCAVSSLWTLSHHCRLQELLSLAKRKRVDSGEQEEPVSKPAASTDSETSDSDDEVWQPENLLW